MYKVQKIKNEFYNHTNKATHLCVEKYMHSKMTVSGIEYVTENDGQRAVFINIYTVLIATGNISETVRFLYKCDYSPACILAPAVW